MLEVTAYQLAHVQVVFDQQDGRFHLNAGEKTVGRGSAASLRSNSLKINQFVQNSGAGLHGWHVSRSRLPDRGLAQ